jgi:hypothetical protein
MRLFEGEAARGTEAITQLAGLQRCARACEKSWKLYRSSRLHNPALKLRSEAYASERIDCILEVEDLMLACNANEAHEGCCCKSAAAEHGLTALGLQEVEPRFGFEDAARILDEWARAESAAIHTYEIVIGCLTRAPAHLDTAPMLKTLWRHHAAFCNTLAEIRTAQTQANQSRELA